jgi:polar amino acid transport system substrate-binding protein
MMRRRALLPALTFLVALAAACTSTGDETMFAPATTQAPPETAAPPTTTAPQVCENNNVDELRSYAPTIPLPTPGRMPAGSFMAEIQANDRLVVGVSADTLLFGARNPISGQLEGFDIDVVKQVALAIFGGELEGVDEYIEYKVINYAARLPSLEDGSVDIVAHTMTINCERWQRIAFSSQYFAAGQKVLVRTDIEANDVTQLGDQRICAAEGSTNIDNIKAVQTTPPIEVVGVADLTDCLVLFQQGAVDAVTGDDTVMAGFAAQDPYAKVIGDQFSREPYGLGVNLGHPEFVQFVNTVLERMRTDGTWTAIYERWLGDIFEGPTPAPPPALYGRQP